jgi:hypothetical protein
MSEPSARAFSLFERWLGPGFFATAKSGSVERGSDPKRKRRSRYPVSGAKVLMLKRHIWVFFLCYNFKV